MSLKHYSGISGLVVNLGSPADMSNKTLLLELQNKSEEIGRLRREVDVLRQSNLENVATIKTLRGQLDKKTSDDTITCMQVSMMSKYFKILFFVLLVIVYFTFHY